MSKRAEVLKKLYERGKVTREGLMQAVADGVITAEEYEQIVGYEINGI